MPKKVKKHNKLPRRKQRGISRNYLAVYAASGGVLTRMRKSRESA